MKRANKLIGNKVNLILIAFSIVLIIFFINSVSGLNAGILGGKMVLYAKTGEVIDKSIKVINNNTFPVIIEITPSGDISNDIKIIDNNFTVDANSEKDARFSIRITQEGKSEGSIVVKFKPANIEDGKNGIALPASIIIFAEKGDETDNAWNDWFSGNDDENTNDDNINDINSDDKSSKKLNPMVIGLSITAVVFVVFLVLLIMYYSKNKNKNKEGKGEKLNHKKSRS